VRSGIALAHKQPRLSPDAYSLLVFSVVSRMAVAHS
jgi:hypothetical protein